jgi:hypothetical protein
MHTLRAGLVVGGQRKVAVAIVCWWSRYGQPGFWMLTVALQGRMAVSQPSIRREGWRVPPQPNPVRPTPWAYDGVYLEKVRSQFLSLRHLPDFVRRTPIFDYFVRSAVEAVRFQES